jgi:exodeoxyribonuclease V alpha subunit
MSKPYPDQGREILAGLVARVTFHNPDNGFCILRVKALGNRDLVTTVGHAATISAGEWITASGVWINDCNHGPQSKANFRPGSQLRRPKRNGVQAQDSH